MKLSLFPREEKFFDLFEKGVQNLKSAVSLLEQVFQSRNGREKIIVEINNIEHKGDTITHDIIEKLNRSFITPFDREDIHRLTADMDDILDMVDGVADRILMYKIKKLPGRAIAMMTILKTAVDELERVINSLRDLKNPQKIMKSCIEINRLENEGDTLIKSAMASMFNSKMDALEFLKIKEIYDHLERAIDKCEDVADSIEGILVKNA